MTIHGLIINRGKFCLLLTMILKIICFLGIQNHVLILMILIIFYAKSMLLKKMNEPIFLCMFISRV